jgi:hypothetical protein
LGLDGYSSISFGIAGTEVGRFDSSGNLGIGTTSPTATLHVYQSASGSTAARFNHVNGNGIVVNPSYNYYDAYNHIFRSLSGTTTEMTLDASGNLLVGTTSAFGKNYTSQSANSIGLGVETTASGYTSSAFQTGVYGTVAGTGFRHIQCINASAVTVFQVLGNGNAQNTNNSYGAISDAKLKENIVDATPKLADLMQVKVRNYNMINDTTKQIGVVAQELETVFPGMIDETSDYEDVTTTDEDGNETTERVPTGTKTKSVKYSVFVPMLIKALQELNAKFDAYVASHP